MAEQRQLVVSSGSAGYKSYKRPVLEDDEFIDMPQHQLLELLAPLKNQYKQKEIQSLCQRQTICLSTWIMCDHEGLALWMDWGRGVDITSAPLLRSVQCRISIENTLINLWLLFSLKQ